ncbi:site-specific integrase [Prochlorococcus marinus]|uniref:site-specific integrase n=1 Tax=Prochlorococcus marinus TaxID=1219 RepID=UPI0022B46901|nr:site-specific integrase [Prochlorococcus marinus]
MSFSSQLFNINNKLATQGIKLRIEKRGNRLGLRGPMPCPNESNKKKDQRISLGLTSTMEGLEQAEKLLQLVYLQIEHNQFNWKNWGSKNSKGSFKKNYSDIEDATERFKQHFFCDTFKSKSKSSQQTNWVSAYQPYIYRFKALAKTKQGNINQEHFIKTLTSYSENSRSRQQCGTTLKAFAKFLDIKLPENWKDMAYGYGMNKAQFRKLPPDSLIEKTYNLIPNPKWKLVYGLMATYGLRNHEVFFCDLSCFRQNSDQVLRVFPNTKTGEHQVWPFPPEWIKLFKLTQLSEDSNLLPEINTDLTKTTLQNVGRRVSEQFRRYKLPITPYDLRHAWAIRTIHIGLPDTVSARMMGHSVAIHNRTYHHWITRRDQQQAVDKALGSKLS